MEFHIPFKGNLSFRHNVGVTSRKSPRTFWVWMRPPAPRTFSLAAANEVLKQVYLPNIMATLNEESVLWRALNKK